MNTLYGACAWLMRADLQLPTDLMKTVQQNIEQQGNKTAAWRHFGGLFAPLVGPLLDDYSQCSVREKSEAVALGAELSFRLALGRFFSGIDELQSMSVVSFIVAVRARLEQISAERVYQILSLALQKMPQSQFSVSSENSVQWELLHQWVDICYRSEQRAVWRPELFLSASFSQLGSIWFSRQILWSGHSELRSWHSALLALEDIYQRHQKAADKRLRPDQIVSIEIELPHFLCEIASESLRNAVAVYCTKYGWEEEMVLDAPAREILSKIQVRYSTEQSLSYWEQSIESLRPLFAGVSVELFQRYALQRFSDKRRIRRLLSDVKYERTQWNTSLSPISFGLCSSVVIYTSRGGKWTSKF